MTHPAQLVALRGGAVAWYRRDAGELWHLTADGAAVARAAPRHAWLLPGPDGAIEVVEAPPTARHSRAFTRHPRAGHALWASEDGLVGLAGHGGPGGVTGLAWAVDARRLYAVCAGGQVWSAAARVTDGGELLADAWEVLARCSTPPGEALGLAVAPAGLLISSQQGLYGVNLRERSIALLAQWPALRARAVAEPAPRAAPAVAADAAGWMYLADAAALLRVRADGSGLTCLATA